MKIDCNDCLYCTLTEYEQYYISQKYKKLLKHYCALTEKEIHHCNCGNKVLVPVPMKCDGEKFEKTEKKKITEVRMCELLQAYQEGIFL